jgi:hypothetical protein
LHNGFGGGVSALKAGNAGVAGGKAEVDECGHMNSLNAFVRLK